MKPSIVPRILLSLLGLAFISWGMGNMALGLIGEPATAVVTEIRREGGERTDGKPGRYTYNIGYTFTIGDGKEINGFTKKIGDAVYTKADGTSTIRIRYFPGFPHFNALEADTGLGVGSISLILAGSVLIFSMTKGRA